MYDTPAGADPTLCQLALPCIGRFMLRACAQPAPAPGAATVIMAPGQPQPACKELALGRNETEWEAAPLQGHERPALRLRTGRCVTVRARARV